MTSPPKKSNRESRIVPMTFRVTKAEAEMIEKKAAKAKNRNVFLREKILEAIGKK